MRVYIAGPMTGYKWYNFPAFDKAELEIKAAGHTPINPAALDMARGVDPYDLPIDHDWDTQPPGFDLHECILIDVEHVLIADEMVLLPGWEQSTGAPAERAVASWARKRVSTLAEWLEAHSKEDTTE